MNRCYRRLPLGGLYNARDLGGYPTRDGGMTKYGVFIRSEAPRDLPESDLLFLRAYGVKASVDFRGDKEVSRQPSCLDGVAGMDYFRSPTFNEQVAFGTRDKGKKGPPVSSFVDWGQKYAEMADDCRDWVREVFGILDSIDGGVLFHCTTGKDRTGVVSALLLGLAGVPEDDIVADYCISEVYLTPVYEELRAEFVKHWPSETVRS
jgi:protein-tyrosine phosphatase